MGLLLALSACHQSEPTTTPASTLESNQSTGHTPRNAANTNTRTGVSTAAPATARSFAILIQELPAKKQTEVREWYRRIGGPSMQDATAAQVAWMQARHYPMPADIARAASMSKAELKAAAGGGDITAQFLYVARLLNEYNADVSAGMPPGTDHFRLLSEISLTMPEVLASGSPYAGYLFAAKYRLMHPGSIESNAATQSAGLVWASKFGDTRANRLLATPTLQAVNATTAGTAISLILTQAMYANPRLFSTPVSTIPPSRH